MERHLGFYFDMEIEVAVEWAALDLADLHRLTDPLDVRAAHAVMAINAYENMVYAQRLAAAGVLGLIAGA